MLQQARLTRSQEVELQRQADIQRLQDKMRRKMEQYHAAPTKEQNQTSPAPSPKCDLCDGLGVTHRYRTPSGQDFSVRESRVTLFLQTYPDSRVIASIMCLCQESKRLQRLWGDAGVPKKRLHCSFEAFDALATEYRAGKMDARTIAGMLALGDATDFEGETKNSLTLAGETGVGKSGLMACIARAWMDRGASVLWVDVLEFIEAIRKTYDDDKAGNAAALVESAQRAGLLCLDDLGDMRLRGKMGQPGFGEASDHTREKIYSVIRYRYENELPTIFTTNLSKEQMAAQFGQRITDRIREMSHWVTVSGKNLRFGE